MILRNLIIFCVVASTLLSSCDDGRIYPPENDIRQEGHTIEIKCRLDGVKDWNATRDYFLSAAAFADDGSGYALVSLNIAGGNNDALVLTGVPAEASTVKICILDRLRKEVVSLASMEIAGAPSVADTLRLDAGALDVSPLAALQDAVFTPTCSACHGGGAQAAASLSLLTANDTHKNTIGIPAHRATEQAPFRVMPGEADSSLLYLALTTDISSSWAYDHSVELVNPSLRDILRLWITTSDE
ncbi:MAG: hypothetical protein NC342_05100 [Pseudoflavonifractor sp.]|nr:hypothetical protein [Alloprevotella sp.]MCM1116896.1 hypothetical protein [Pseudoflavonifractor sp.]